MTRISGLNVYGRRTERVEGIRKTKQFLRLKRRTSHEAGDVGRGKVYAKMYAR